MQFRNHRYPTRFDATFSVAGQDRSGIMVSISGSGAKVEIDSALDVGQKVIFALPTGPTPAIVRWVMGKEAGFQFARELSIAAVDRIRFGAQRSRGRSHHMMQFSEMR